MRRTDVMIAGFALLVSLARVSEAAPNIFDDDWTPPKRVEAPPPVKPEPSPAKPEAVPTAASKVVTPPSPPSESPAAAAPVAARRPVPPKAELATARNLMREVFAKELADRSVPARRALAARLLDEAARSADRPVDRYVLLGGAYQAAREGADVELCLKAADAVADAYQVDRMAMKLAALSAVAAASPTPETARALTSAGLELLGEAIAEDNYDAARTLATQVEQSAARASEPSLAALAKEKAKDARLVAGEHARVQKDEAAVRARPDDARAAEAVGRFRCFVKGDWANGLPLLARGADANLRAAAAAELSKPEGPARARLADDWWSVAAKNPGRPQFEIQRHAAEHYRAAAASLSGLEKLRVEKRLAEVMPFALTAGDAYHWSRGKPAVDMIAINQGVCVLLGIGGRFDGMNDGVGIGVGEGGVWQLNGRAAFDPVATAGALLTPGPGVFKAPVEYEWKSGAAPVRMIRTDEGVCVLAGVVGGLRGGGEDVRVYPGDDGYWYLAGRALVPLTARAIALRAAKAGSYRAIYVERQWSVKTGPVTVMSKDDGFCFISGVSGKLEGTGEQAALSIGEDGLWRLSGSSAQESMTVRAIGVRILPPRP
jgi:hypothetical protein